MRPRQRFVALRSSDNQVAVMRHRVREQLVGQRTALVNALRGHLSKIGLVAAQGAQHAYRLKRMLADCADENGEIVVPERSRCARAAGGSDRCVGSGDYNDRRQAHRNGQRRQEGSPLDDDTGRRPVIASAVVATVGEVSSFASGREFAAFPGLAPRRGRAAAKSASGASRKW